MGIQLFLSNDNVVLLFNDNSKNINLNENSTSVALAWSIGIKPMSVILDADSKQKRQLVGGLENFDLIPVIMKGYFVSENKIFIPAVMKTKTKLGVISVE